MNGVHVPAESEAAVRQEAAGMTGLEHSYWKETFEAVLPRLGHRNWIVIADAAFPHFAKTGFQTVPTDCSLSEVLDDVLHCIDRVGHLRPVIHLDSELSDVPESEAPGADAVRSCLQRRLNRYPVACEWHADLLQRLEGVADHFKILVLKTTAIVPYCSIFIELDCGYWSPEAEALLREKIQSRENPSA